MIVNFTVYNETTGTIMRTGTAPADMVSMQSGDGEKVVVGRSCDECDWVHPGSRTIMREHIMTKDELQAKKNKEADEALLVAKREALIQGRMRKIAITELEKEGKS